MKRQHRRMSIVASLLVGAALVLSVSAPAGAQLATSRWPMLQHDLQHTGQADLLGPAFWPNTGAPGPTTDVKSVTFYDKIKMSPVVGQDGTVYVGMGWQFCAINPYPTMTQKWCTPLIADVSPNAAAIDADGYIYVGDRDNTVYKFRDNGNQVPPTQMWIYNNGHEGDVWTSPTIATNGTIYFAHTQSLDGAGVLTAIKNHPTIPTLFSVKSKIAAGQNGTQSSPTIGQNGLIYLGYADGSVRAYEDTAGGLVQRGFAKPGTIAISASPVIGTDGTVYIGSNNGFHAFNPEPIGGVLTLKWTFPTFGAVAETAALATDGTVYFVSKYQNKRTLYAITPGTSSAASKWEYGPITVNSTAGGFPLIGADGILYVGLGNGVSAFGPATGIPLWNYPTTNMIISAPVLGPPAAPISPATKTTSGTAVLYLGSQDHKVYAISSPRTALSDNASPLIVVQPPGLTRTVNVGDEITFDASQSYDPNGNPVYFSWGLGDGSTDSIAAPTHTYWKAGSYPVILTVSDGIAASVAQGTVTVNGGQTVNFCDTFTRAADSTVLGGPTSVTCPGGSLLTWKEYPDAGDLMISAGQMINAPVKATHIATVPGLKNADQVAAVDFTSVLNSTNPRFGIVLRMQNTENYYLAYRLVGGASVLRLAKVVDGVETVLGQTPVPNPTQNVSFRLLAEAAGTTLTLQLEGSGQTVSVPFDATFAGGSIGILLSWVTTATPQYKVDNFTACSTPPRLPTDPDPCSGIQ